MSKSNLSIGTKIWADKINNAWRASALMVATEVGQYLIDAKAAVPHGDFERMVKAELDFSPQTARKLMKVAGDRRVRDRAQGRALPDHWTTYFKLTQLTDEQLDEAFDSGVINSKMRRSDVPRKRKESPQGDAVLPEGATTLSPVAAAEVVTPQTDAKGEDSAVDFWHGDDSDIAEKVAAETGGDPRYEEEPSDVIRRFANGLALAMAASHELAASNAAENYPANMPLLSEELSLFADWMLDFEAAFRKRYDNGNDAALQSAVAE